MKKIRFITIILIAALAFAFVAYNCGGGKSGDSSGILSIDPKTLAKQFFDLAMEATNLDSEGVSPDYPRYLTVKNKLAEFAEKTDQLSEDDKIIFHNEVKRLYVEAI